MANTNISSYIGDLSSFDSATTAADKLKSDAFDLKQKGLETAKAIGEAKIFLSGKPVSNYAYRAGKKMANEAIDRGVKSLSEFRDAYQTNLGSDFSKATNVARQANQSIQMEDIGDVSAGPAPASSLAGEVESKVGSSIGRGLGENSLSGSGYGTINTFGTVNRATNHYAAKGDYFDSDVDDPEELEESEQATGAAARGAAVNPTYSSFAGNSESLYDNALDEGSIYDNAIDNSARAVANPIYDTVRSGLENPIYETARGVQNPVYDTLQDNTNDLPTPAKPMGTLDGETSAIKDTTKVPKGKGVGEEEVAGSEEKVAVKATVDATEDATDATLDAIPGADIIGVIAGAALAIRSAVKSGRDHVKQAVDNVNSSFQVGI